MPINTVILMGRLVREPEIKETKNGVKYSQNTLAINRDKNNAVFIPFTVWTGTAEFLAKHFKKGNNILIEGYLKNGKFLLDDKELNTIEVVGRSLSFIDPKNKDNTQEDNQDNTQSNIDIEFTEITSDDDLPF